MYDVLQSSSANYFYLSFFCVNFFPFLKYSYATLYCTDTKLHVETVGIGLVCLCCVHVCSTQAGMDAQIWLIGNSGPTTPHLSA
jgi:hypothetical protein